MSGEELQGKGRPEVELAALMRSLNTGIRETAKRLPDDDPPFQFYCECGCWQTVELTIAEYDSLKGAPVYLPEHPIDY